ncbi:MAG TPA: extracellular solute-binding protein, partial [Rugosimonospora sp.]|nr:extracellular solute-binding protein [Rugosimonospora sp.]
GEMLAKGQVAMVFGGSWVSGGVPADQAGDVGEVALPADKQQGSVLYATGWVISSASKNPSAAATVIDFLTSDDELVTAHDAGIILLPPKASALATLAAQDDDPLLKIAQDGAAHGVPFGGLTAEQVDAYNGMLSDLTSSGATSSQDAITALATTIG